MTIHIPYNFTEDLIQDYNPRWRDKYYWVVHSIVFASFTNKINFNGYVNLNMELLQKYLGSNYAKIVIDQLIQSKVIEVQPQYSAGSFSKNYRLRDEFRNAPIVPNKLLKKTFEKKVNRIKESALKEVLKRSKNTLAEFRNLTYFKIDVERATDYVNIKYTKGSEQHKSRILAIYYYDQMHRADLRTEHLKVNFFFKVVKGRIYTPATNLPRDLEQFTYVIGHKEDALTTLDAPNSQLCFADECQKREVQLIENQEDKTNLNNIRNGIEGMEGNEYFTPFCEGEISNHHHSHTYSPYDIHFELNSLIMRGWRDVIFNSKGYEVMMYLTKYNGKEVGHTPKERQEFKGEFFGQLFYNQYKEDYLTPMERTFKEFFPNEFNALRMAKKKYGNKGYAVKVQTLEGDFFHKQVVHLMRTKFKNVPFTIKHDSIKIQNSYLPQVEPELNKLLQNFFGDSRITLKRE